MKLKGYLKNRAKENKGIFLVQKEVFTSRSGDKLDDFLVYESNLMGDFTIYDYE